MPRIAHDTPIDKLYNEYTAMLSGAAIAAEMDLSIRQLYGLQTITATPRQLESLIRISESLARMRLSPVVERSDAAEALRLMQVSCSGFTTSKLCC